jgi:hypothetical protein
MENMSGILTGIAAKLAGRAIENDEGQGVSDIVKAIFNLDGQHGSSITTVAKKTMVGSTVYVESSLSNEDDLMVPLMSVLCQSYIGYVLTALGIYQSVDRYGTISETIGRVSTENLKASGVIDVKAVLEQAFSMNPRVAAEVGMEAFTDVRFKLDIDETMKHLAVGQLIEFDFWVGNGTANDGNDRGKSGNRTFTNDEKNGSHVVTVPIYCQMFPVSMPSDIAVALVQFNYPERFWRRLLKVFTREIGFFKDFIFSIDMVEKHKELLKKDTNNVLADFYKSKIKTQARKVYDIITGRIKNNIANSILIITESTFKNINDTSSIDLTNYADRQRFFNEAYAMMLVVVDTNYNTVDIYLNGIQKKSEHPFRAIKKAGSSKSGVDMDELMKTIAKGAAPQF